MLRKDVAALRSALLECRNPNAKCGSGSALDLAIELHDLAVVKALLDSGAAANERLPHGLTHLERAAVLEDEPIVDALLQAGVSLSSQRMVLQMAASSGRCLLVKKFLSLQVPASGEDGFLALVHAVRGGNTNCVEDLLAAGSPVNGKKGEPQPLYYALRKPEIARRLLEAGANPNAVSPAGIPLLAEPELPVPLETLELLLAHGANPQLRGTATKSPADSIAGNPRICSLLPGNNYPALRSLARCPARTGPHRR